jgi:endonuclease/exonuclease/phosphatase family metal-dependent hydrolase
MHARRLFLLLCAAALAGCTEAPTGIEAPNADLARASSQRTVPITAMTRNLYLGSELGRVFGATDPNQIPFVVASMWSDVVANDFPTRARAIAAEIAAEKPQLVGLQEVSRYHLHAPGQPLVVLDYLAVLLDALNERELNYRVAASVDNLDITMPIVTATGLGLIQFDLRDVILVRADVATSNPATARYQHNLTVPTAAGDITIPRGWTAVDATWHGTTVRFVNTHLEAFHPLINGAQAQELAAILAGEWKSVVLVGDINSGPGDPDNRPAYWIFQQASFQDAWAEARPRQDGFTCCFADLLSELTRVPDQRIDVVLFRQPRDGSTGIDHVSATMVGGRVGDRIWSDRAGALIWPSDHIGVVATLQYREPRPVGPPAK